jgi:hypothetical protein
MPSNAGLRTVIRMHALFVEYGLGDADAAAHGELWIELEPALDAVPGLTAWTRLENRPVDRYAAFYLFASREAFERFAASELYPLLHGVNLAASDFGVAATFRMGAGL